MTLINILIKSGALWGILIRQCIEALGNAIWIQKKAARKLFADWSYSGRVEA